jgi:hypothetical protein
MAEELKRIPLDASEIPLLEKPELTPETIRKLLAFNKTYHEKNLAFFLGLRRRWHSAHPGVDFPGLCANINAITGEFRPDSEQKLWGTGCGRALGIWAEFLILDRVPAALKSGLTEYCRVIYDGLVKRLELNNGCIPFLADPWTCRADPGPLAGLVKPDEANFTLVFSACSITRYGLLLGDGKIIDSGMALMDRCYKAVTNGRFPLDVGSATGKVTLHGPRMIFIGTVVEILECLRALELRGERGFSVIKPGLLAMIGPCAEYILKNHYRSDPPAFWEQGDGRGGSAANANGKKVVDPGHATECAGFLAEAMGLVPENWSYQGLDRAQVINAALNMHLFADKAGFSKIGLMNKYVDLDTGEALPDTQALNAGGRLTAPWWNVREHCAAALRLYTLTKDKRCLASFQRGQRASYVFYPNKRIDWQMVQTADPVTGEALDIAPATGNLDAMHDPRARLRETLNLERLL